MQVSVLLPMLAYVPELFRRTEPAAAGGAAGVTAAAAAAVAALADAQAAGDASHLQLTLPEDKRAPLDLQTFLTALLANVGFNLLVADALLVGTLRQLSRPHAANTQPQPLPPNALLAGRLTSIVAAVRTSCTPGHCGGSLWAWVCIYLDRSLCTRFII